MAESRKLEGRIALVTGASSGIGRGIALAFAREGARVAVVDLQETPKRGKWHETEAAAPTAVEIAAAGGEACFLQADLSQEADTRRVVQQTVDRLGGLDILVNNAGIHVPAPMEALSLADWDRVMALNLRAVFIASQAALPHLKQSRCGRIIHIASVHSFGGGAGPAYAPAKAAVLNLTHDTAIEVGKYGITVNAICPGYIETPLQDYLTAEQIEACLKRTPLPRLGRPSDIAKAAVFLASDDAEWITGTSLVVDGGYTAYV